MNDKMFSIPKNAKFPSGHLSHTGYHDLQTDNGIYSSGAKNGLVLWAKYEPILTLL